MAGAGSGFGPRAVWGFHPQTPGTLRWGDFLSDEKGTKESPEGQGRRFPHRQSGFLSSSGLVPADEVLFPVSLGGASFFLNDQKETKESPGVGRGWLSAQRAGLGQSACTPGPPLRARGRQLKCQHSFSARKVDTWEIPSVGSALVPPKLSASAPPWGACLGIRLESKCVYRVQTPARLAVFRSNAPR